LYACAACNTVWMTESSILAQDGSWLENSPPTICLTEAFRRLRLKVGSLAENNSRFVLPDTIKIMSRLSFSSLRRHLMVWYFSPRSGGSLQDTTAPPFVLPAPLTEAVWRGRKYLDLLFYSILNNQRSKHNCRMHITHGKVSVSGKIRECFQESIPQRL
jgi:hypothetical protein